MKLEGLATLAFGILIVILIASTDAFSQAIGGFTRTIGIYGFIIGVLIVPVILAGFLRFGENTR